MKSYELHLLNRIYLSTFRNKIFSLDEHEDVVDPFKLQAILDQRSSIHWDFIHKRYSLTCQVPKKYSNGIHRDFFYMMTNSIDVFNLPEKENLYEWLVDHWDDKFLITFPIYTYQDKTYSFNIQEVRFEEQSDSDIEVMIHQKQYTIANGLILILSLNNWPSDILLDAVRRLFLVRPKYETVKLFWMPYYNIQSLLLTDYLIFYAFQHTCEKIYRLIYAFEADNHYNYYNSRVPLFMYMNVSYTKNYFCSLLTVHSKPTIEHYRFLKETHQNNLLHILEDYPHFKHNYYDLHSRLKQIFSSTSLVYDFLSKGLTFRLFIHTIYINKHLGILKTIQSLCFFYSQTSISKPKIKFVWRLILNQFPKDSSYILCGYMVEYLIYQFNRSNTYHLNKPPMKLLRDSIFLLEPYIEYSKQYKIRFRVQPIGRYIIPECLHPYLVTSSSNQYVFHITYFKALQCMDANIYNTLKKRKEILLKSIYHSNYDLYKILRTYYKQHPDELWRRNK